MSKGIKNLLGHRFGKLVVVELVCRSDQGKQGTGTPTKWRCKCDCGGEHIVSAGNLGSGAVKSCGCLPRICSRGANNRQWKGGRTKRPTGYITVTVYDYPDSEGKSKHVLEHVYVMAKALRRPLHKGEVVHHRNGVRDDNRIENLELWNTSHPRGSRVSETTIWAIEWLMQYAPDCLKQPVSRSINMR